MKLESVCGQISIVRVCVYIHQNLGTLCQLVVFPCFCQFYIYVQVFTEREREKV